MNYVMITDMDAQDDRTGVYSIGAVARMVDVPTQTLRSWEDRYAVIVPVRSQGGQRLYTRDHVEELRFVRDKVHSGLQPADAHRLLRERRRDRASATEPVLGAAVDGGPSEEAHLRILIAERDPYAAEFAEYFLRTEGYITTIVLNGDDVARGLTDNRPDLLVLDLMISGGAGLTLCRDVRAHHTLPMLAVSAVASEDVALDAGADAFLLKPVQPLQFVSTVRDLLGTSAYLHRNGKP